MHILGECIHPEERNAPPHESECIHPKTSVARRRRLPKEIAYASLRVATQTLPSFYLSLSTLVVKRCPKPDI